MFLIIVAFVAIALVGDRPARPAPLAPEAVQMQVEAAPLPTAVPTPAPTPTAFRRPSKAEASYILSPSLPETSQKRFLPPLRIKIDSIGVDAPIVATGLDANGEMEAPDGPDTVGWFSRSVVPGQIGNAVLAGHVDWRTQTAVFWRLRELKTGDAISVYSPDGTETHFTVLWSRSYPEASVPLSEVLGKATQPVLTVITCAGDFDRTKHNYSNRLVVRAQKDA